MSQVGIKDSWTLVAFRNAFGKMQVSPELTNGETGEKFKTCSFTNNEGKVTLVNFSSNLTSIDTNKSPEEIARQIASQKDDLQVVQLESDTYKLCKKGASNWTEVEL